MLQKYCVILLYNTIRWSAEHAEATWVTKVYYAQFLLNVQCPVIESTFQLLASIIEAQQANTTSIVVFSRRTGLTIRRLHPVAVGQERSDRRTIDCLRFLPSRVGIPRSWTVRSISPNHGRLREMVSPDFKRRSGMNIIT